MGTGDQGNPGGHPHHTVERHEAATDPEGATSVVLHKMDEDAQQASSEVDAYAEADASDDSTAQVEVVDAECWVQIQLHEVINESAKRY